MNRSPENLLRVENQVEKLCELKLMEVQKLIAQGEQQLRETQESAKDTQSMMESGQVVSVEARFANLERIHLETERIQNELLELNRHADALRRQLLVQGQRTDGLEQLVTEYHQQRKSETAHQEQIQQLDRISFRHFNRDGSP